MSWDHYVTISWMEVERTEHFGIVKTWNKAKTSENDIGGPTKIIYDVEVMENGHPGDIVESFRTLKEARKYVREMEGKDVKS